MTETAPEVKAWFADRVPQSWFEDPPEVDVDADELLVTGRLAGTPKGQVEGFREATREERMRIAQEAEHRFGRKVSWAVRADGERFLFSNLSLPVMTRLRLPERQVLDTLVGAGVARSRSDALAWCVRLVARHEADWIAELKEALVKVGELRRKGPA